MYDWGGDRVSYIVSNPIIYAQTLYILYKEMYIKYLWIYQTIITTIWRKKHTYESDLPYTYKPQQTKVYLMKKYRWRVRINLIDSSRRRRRRTRVFVNVIVVDGELSNIIFRVFMQKLFFHLLPVSSFVVLKPVKHILPLNLSIHRKMGRYHLYFWRIRICQPFSVQVL